MNFVTFVWPMSAAVAFTLGAIQAVVWIRDRKGWANLVFAMTAFAGAGVSTFEFALMHANIPERFGELLQWGHVPVFFLVAGIALFVRLHFGTGRWWLVGAIVGTRFASLVLNFVMEPNLNYRAITSLQQVELFGTPVWVVADGVRNPWTRLGEFSSVLLLIFIIDASRTLWRKGTPDARRLASLIGGSITIFILIAATNSALIHAGILRVPYLINFPFLALIIAMGSELSRDVIRASRLAEQLRESAGHINLAADAAHLALWRWDIPKDVIWISPDARGLYGFPQEEKISLSRFIDTLHPADRDLTRSAVDRALGGDGEFRAEYRVLLGEGGQRWISAQGRVEFDEGRQPMRMRGLSMDITERKFAELQAAQRLDELAHFSRVVTLSQLSGSLAHELNQPLAVILSNAQAAQRIVALDPVDLAEVRDILSDIVAEDRRAGEVIQRLRTLLKHGETNHAPLFLNEAVEEVLRLLRSDLIAREITVQKDLAPDLPPVGGDRIQIQQIVLNLVINAADAMAGQAVGTRTLKVATDIRGGSVRLSVRDFGCGLPEDTEQIFAPFFTTKTHGLGMGLAICRSIASAHQGRLWAEPQRERGAVFHFELPSLHHENAQESCPCDR